MMRKVDGHVWLKPRVGRNPRPTQRESSQRKQHPQKEETFDRGAGPQVGVQLLGGTQGGERVPAGVPAGAEPLGQPAVHHTGPDGPLLTQGRQQLQRRLHAAAEGRAQQHHLARGVFFFLLLAT